MGTAVLAGAPGEAAADDVLDAVWSVLGGMIQLKTFSFQGECKPLSSDNTSMTTQLNPVLRYGASVSLISLIVLCLLWELKIAPLRPGGSLLALKALPLLLPLRGVLKGNLYTMQWAAMLILLYFMEGVVRAWSDPSPLSAVMGGLEIFFSLVFYLCAIFYLKPAKRAAKRNAAQRATKGS